MKQLIRVAVLLAAMFGSSLVFGLQPSTAWQYTAWVRLNEIRVASNTNTPVGTVKYYYFTPDQLWGFSGACSTYSDIIAVTVDSSNIAHKDMLAAALTAKSMGLQVQFLVDGCGTYYPLQISVK